MNRVTRYAVPTPLISTPSSHACPVKSGSRPMVLSKHQAANTEIANCAHSSAETFMAGAYHG